MLNHLRSALSACRGRGHRACASGAEPLRGALGPAPHRCAGRCGQHRCGVVGVRHPHGPRRSFAAAAADDEGSADKMADAAGEAQADSGAPKMVVFGGNGFVGSRVCEQGVNMGLKVVSVSRSGRPGWLSAAWAGHVDWQKGDALEPASYSEILKGATAAVSCVGGFGTNEAMYRICGRANISAIDAAAAAGVKRFVFISVHDYKAPGFFLDGYFRGKLDAEKALQEKFGDNGVSLRPSLIHGTRNVSGFDIPLGAFFGPVEKGLNLIPNIQQLTELPVIGAALLPPVSVDAVGKAAATAAVDPSVPGGTMDVWAIAKYV
ncbi:unnamed protein product [Ostreobium quekettii]|uniref:NAD(P)-binding domain-containing protein n=1 Tax=Ostreobium quekettii TaxID=121088 RepID=A0A8S1INM2_9CHLO|nr:unnamed protein product [Ostreobium quekettii]